MAWLDLPRMRMLTEYSPSCVKMPDRMAGMPHTVWNSPVTSPASMPAAIAAKSARYGFTPRSMSMTATAPPVAMLPSTVMSE